MRRLALLLLPALMAPSLAAAQVRSAPLILDKAPQSYRSPQRFALEIKFGPYSPNIDSTPGLTGTPFSDLFVSQDDAGHRGQRPPGKLLTTVEFDWQFLHGFGSLGLGVSWGFHRRETHSFEFSDPTSRVGCQVPYCKRSSDTTALNVMPLTLEVVYRFDVLALRYKVPLVPYLKGGIGYYFWFIQRGDNSLSSDKLADGSTDRSIGGTLGLVAHPGLAFMLDVIDQSAARVLDAELGINHSYLFCELNYAWVTGLGFKDKMVLSDLTWSAGAAFEFLTRRIRLVVEYEGTDFAGWQRQENGPSVQAALEEALERMTGAPTVVRGAGRTDAGVHALGQVAAFDTEKGIAPLGFQRGLNALLPPSIAVAAADEAPPDFDPRRHARGKLYRYTIWNREARSPLRARTSWHVRRPLDLEAMRRAAALLVGEHDFRALRAADCDRKNTVRRVERLEVRGEEGAVVVEVEATAFLKHMVRILVGTLGEVGRGAQPPEWVAEVLRGGDRRRAGPTAPPQGLVLVEVRYPEPLPSRR